MFNLPGGLNLIPRAEDDPSGEKNWGGSSVILPYKLNTGYINSFFTINKI